MKITIDNEGRIIEVTINNEESYNKNRKVIYTEKCDECKFSEVINCKQCLNCPFNAKTWER